MLICEGELYIERHSVGPFKVYLALEGAINTDDIVKVVDLTRDNNVYLTSNTVISFDGDLEEELMNVARKYDFV